MAPPVPRSQPNQPTPQGQRPSLSNAAPRNPGGLDLSRVQIHEQNVRVVTLNSSTTGRFLLVSGLGSQLIGAEGKQFVRLDETLIKRLDGRIDRVLFDPAEELEARPVKHHDLQSGPKSGDTSLVFVRLQLDEIDTSIDKILDPSQAPMISAEEFSHFVVMWLSSSSL